MKRALFLSLLVLMLAGACRADMMGSMLGDKFKPMDAWAKDNKIDDKVLGRFFDTITRKGKAKPDEMSLRAAALLEHISLPSVSFTAQPLQVLEQAMANPRIFEASAHDQRVAELTSQKGGKGTCFDSYGILEEAASTGNGIGEGLPKAWFIPKSMKLSLFKVLLYARYASLKESTWLPCAKSPGLFEDFEPKGAGKGLMVFADTGKGATATAQVEEGVGYKGGKGLHLRVSPKGWGLGAILGSSYVREPYGTVKTLEFWTKTEVDVDYSVEIYEGLTRGGDGEKWKLPWGSLKLKASPQWQKVSLLLADFAPEAKERENGVLDLSSIRALGLYITGPQFKNGAIYIDEVYFRSP